MGEGERRRGDRDAEDPAQAIPVDEEEQKMKLDNFQETGKSRLMIFTSRDPPFRNFRNSVGRRSVQRTARLQLGARSGCGSSWAMVVCEGTGPGQRCCQLQGRMAAALPQLPLG